MIGSEWKNTLAIQKGGALYPTEWNDLSDAPDCLYAVGDVSLLKARKLTIVGSRRTPAYALKIGAQIAKDLSSVFVIVTGTADVVD